MNGFSGILLKYIFFRTFLLSTHSGDDYSLFPSLSFSLFHMHSPQIANALRNTQQFKCDRIRKWYNNFINIFIHADLNQVIETSYVYLS